MTTTPNVAVFRGNRRVRVTWTGPLGAGAFTTPTPYAVTSVDGAGFNPITVGAVFAVATDPNSVELAVNADWAAGGVYQVGFAAVPCADLTNYTGTLAAQVPFQPGAAPNQEPAATGIDALLFGRDLAHDGNDLVEYATGDLLTVTGPANWQSAIVRRELSQGLTWDPAYSPQAAEYVDAPAFYQKPLAGRVVAQALADRRTKTASVAVIEDPNNPASFTFRLTLVAINGAGFSPSFSPP